MPQYDGAKMTLHDLLDQYDSLRSIRPTSLSQMTYAAKSLERHAGGSLEALNKLAVSKWVRDLERSGKSSSTVRSYRGAVISLWNFAHEQGLVSERPDGVRKVRDPHRNAVAFSRSEVSRLLGAAERQPGLMRWGLQYKVSSYWTALLSVAWESALRRGDLLDGLYADCHGLRWEEIAPLENGCGMLLRTQNKTEWQCEAILSPETMGRLERIRHNETYVFPWPVSASSFWDQWRKLRVAAKVRPLPFKCVRRASITDVALRDMTAAAQQAGHKPGSPVTAKAYIDWTQIAPHRQRPAPLDERENPGRK